MSDHPWFSWSYYFIYTLFTLKLHEWYAHNIAALSGSRTEQIIKWYSGNFLPSHEFLTLAKSEQWKVTATISADNFQVPCKTANGNEAWNPPLSPPHIYTRANIECANRQSPMTMTKKTKRKTQGQSTPGCDEVFSTRHQNVVRLKLVGAQFLKLWTEKWRWTVFQLRFRLVRDHSRVYKHTVPCPANVRYDVGLLWCHSIHILTPIFEQFMATLVIKKGHQLDTCHNENGAQIKDVHLILGFITKTSIERSLYVII